MTKANTSRFEVAPELINPRASEGAKRLMRFCAAFTESGC